VQQWESSDTDLSYLSLSNSNRTMTRLAFGSNGYKTGRGSVVISGKKYWEIEVDANRQGSSNFYLIGVSPGSANGTVPGITSNNSCTFGGGRSGYTNGSQVYVSPFASQTVSSAGDTGTNFFVGCLAYDSSNRYLWMGALNGSNQPEWFHNGSGYGNPAAGTNPAFVVGGSADMYPVGALWYAAGGDNLLARFLAAHIVGTPPSGFSAF
jgi:hypothetical protein